jgi:hypothetical protein
MTWEEARKRIEEHVGVGDDVNSEDSTGRLVKHLNPMGYIIPRGYKKDMTVTWEMLEKCWKGMVVNGGKYDNTVFGKHYPREKKNSGCYVQTIHMIFQRAGLTLSEDA